MTIPRPGSYLRIGRRIYKVESVELHRGKPWASVYGPLGNERWQGGGTVYLGEKPTSRVSAVTGKRIRVPVVKWKPATAKEVARALAPKRRRKPSTRQAPAVAT